MHIEREHKVGKAEAVRKIDALLDALTRQELPAGVTIKEAFKSWSENVMQFSFKAKKSFFGATISGIIRIDDDSIILDADVPALVTAFVSEDQIKGVINEQLDREFGPP
jgi:hypothetical protein